MTDWRRRSESRALFCGVRAPAPMSGNLRILCQTMEAFLRSIPWIAVPPPSPTASPLTRKQSTEPCSGIFSRFEYGEASRNAGVKSPDDVARSLLSPARDARPCQLLRNVIGLDAVQEIRVGRRRNRSEERQFHLQLMISG